MTRIFTDQRMTDRATTFDDLLSRSGAESAPFYKKKGVEYMNVPCSFDIETTSFYDDQGEKRATMYEWTFGINGVLIIGRTWDEFDSLISFITEKLNLSVNHRLVCYCHNLSFEFNWIRFRFRWKNVFAINRLSPVYAVSDCGIEFRCSYLLSGYDLATLGKNLVKYPVQKMVGDLDYSKYRHSYTPMTDKELRYCENDVRVVMAYIQERIEDDGNITRIQLTKTGYVRKYCRDSCMYVSKAHSDSTWKAQNYRRMMSELTLDVDTYAMAKRAFHGGFTHANAYHAGKTLYNVDSFDFTSSYPSVMVCEKIFPMSRGKDVTIDRMSDFYHYIDCYFCLFDVEFIDIHALDDANEHPISIYKCWSQKGVIEDNGRLISGQDIKTTVTDIDFKVIRKFYSWKEIRFGKFKIFRRGYLPKDFVDAILNLYEQKTTLKGVEGKEQEYMRGKEMLNSCY